MRRAIRAWTCAAHKGVAHFPTLRQARMALCTSVGTAPLRRAGRLVKFATCAGSTRHRRRRSPVYLRRSRCSCVRMSFQSRGDRRRELALSPPAIIKKGRSADNLEAILLKQSSHHAAELCFGFCRPFRNNPKYSLSPTFKPIRGGPQSRLARDWKTARPCPSPLSLTKSVSMPELYGDEVLAPPPQLSAVAERNVWVCKGCNEGGTHRLALNSEGGLSCVCGAVAEGVNMVSLERAKNCHKDDDPTQVGEVQAPSAAQTAPWRDGPVGKEERTRRENAQLGGTHVPNHCARKNDMQQAQSAVERQARKDAAELCRADAPDQGRGKKLLDGLELAFRKMPALRNDMPLVAAHIRLEAVRIYQLSVRHERTCCPCQARRCTYALSSRHMVVLTLGIIELVLSQLAGIERGDGRLVDEITQGNNNYQDIERALAQLYQCRRVPDLVRSDAALGAAERGALQDLHVADVVRAGRRAVCQCDAGRLRHPRAQAASPPRRGSTAPASSASPRSPDPADNAGKLRDRSSRRSSRSRPMDTETKAMPWPTRLQVPARAARVPQAWTTGLPRDVLAVCRRRGHGAQRWEGPTRRATCAGTSSGRHAPRVARRSTPSSCSLDAARRAPAPDAPGSSGPGGASRAIERGSRCWTRNGSAQQPATELPFLG